MPRPAMGIGVLNSLLYLEWCVHFRYFQFAIDKERGQSSLSPSSTQVLHRHHPKRKIKKQENSSQKTLSLITQNPDTNSQYHKHKISVLVPDWNNFKPPLLALFRDFVPILHDKVLCFGQVDDRMVRAQFDLEHFLVAVAVGCDVFELVEDHGEETGVVIGVGAVSTC